MNTFSFRFSNRELRLAVFLCLLGLSVTSCGKKPAPQTQTTDLSNADTYTLEVMKDRKMKDLHFLRDESSPLTYEDKQVFEGLAYYPVDKSYAFYTALTPLKTPEDYTIATSKDRPRTMAHIGYLPFSFEGNTYKLAVFAPKDTSDGYYWFIPFTDATSGKETYGAGRFLDIENPADSVFLDFNYAYSPYCAYNDRYDCPIPPVENRLPIPIRAEEKNYPLSHH